jgi:uncharacterized protein YdgA (DUF945 family)
MRTKFGLLLLVILVAVGGYSSAAWWIGVSTERQLGQTEEQLVDTYSYITLLSRDYHRGVFSSTEDVTYAPGGSLSQLLRASPAGRDLSSLRWTVHNTIHHGPFPGLRTAALATIDSELLLPAEMRQHLSTVLQGKPIVAVHTTLGFSGASTAELLSPAFEYRTPDGTRVTWRGVTGSMRAASAMSTWSGTMSAPGLTLDSPRGGLELLGFDVSATMQRALDTVYVGQSAFHLATIALHSVAGGTPLSIQGISLQGDTTMNAGYLDEHATVSADRVDAAQFSLTRIGYEQSLNHLDAESFAGLMSEMRAVQRDIPSGGAGRGAAARVNVDILRRYAFEMALHQPVLEIERLGFVTPEGELRLSAKLAMPGLRREELQGAMAALAILQHLDATADLRVDEALLNKLLDASGKRELLSAQLQQLETQGYLRHDGTALTTHLIYRAGVLTINGQPFRAMRAAAAR